MYRGHIKSEDVGKILRYLRYHRGKYPRPREIGK